MDQYPVFITCRDRLTPLLALIAWLERIGISEIYLLDNDSTFPPLLDYYRRTKHRVIHLGTNVGPHALWHLGLLESLGVTGPYIVTDPDLMPIDECPDDAIAVLSDVLDRFPDRVKAGLGLRIDDLPDHYPKKASVLRWERRFWSTELAPGIYDALVDTTFALYRPGLPFAFGPAARTGPPYVVRHIPWYTDPTRASAEEEYYRDHANTAASSWPLPRRRRSRPKADLRDGAVPVGGEGAAERPDSDSPSPDVLVIVPSRSRPDSSVAFAEAFRAHSTRSDLVFALDDDDSVPYPRLDGVRYEVNPRLRLVGTLNLVAAKYRDRYEYLAFMGDDNRIRTAAWDRLLVEAIEDLPAGIAYGNDLLQGARLPTAVLMKAEVVRTLGFMVPPDLIHLYADNVWRDIGLALGSLRYRDDVIIEHMHFSVGKAAVDPIYEASNVSEAVARDRRAYERYTKSRLNADVDRLTTMSASRLADNDPRPWHAPGIDPAPPAEESARRDEGQVRLRIVEATYGYGKDTMDVTARVQALVQDGRLPFVASNALFTDPCPGRPKTLRVRYGPVGDGGPYRCEVAELGIVELPNLLRIAIRGESFWVVPAHDPPFWALANAGGWEPGTFVVLDRLLSKGTPFVDCGAWIGPTALYAACKGAAVTAFECDPVAIRRLKENLSVNPRLNKRVTLIEAGLSDRDAPFDLHPIGSDLGASGSSMFDVEPHRPRVTVPGLETRRVFAEAGWLNDPTALIKIDTEGAEYRMLSSLGSAIADAACSFYVSFHPFNLMSKDARPDRLIRARAALACLDQFWDYVWWVADATALRRIDKEHVLELAMGGRALPEILFSRRDDLDDLDVDVTVVNESPIQVTNSSLDEPPRLPRREEEQASLRIVAATYGSGKVRVDVTARVRALVRDGRLRCAVTNDTLGGDPCPGRPKALRVTYEQSGDDRRRRHKVAEHGTVFLPRGTEELHRIVPPEPVRGAYKANLGLSARGMDGLRCRLHIDGGAGPRKRDVFLNVAFPGAIHHDLDAVWLDVDSRPGAFELALAGALAPDESLTAIAIAPVDAQLRVTGIEPDMVLDVGRADVEHVPDHRAGTRFVAERFPDRPLVGKRGDGKRDAVVFAWWVPPHPEASKVGEYFLGLLQYHHADSKIFVGINHGSDPNWIDRLKNSGLDVEIALVRPEINVTSDVAGFLAALEAYSNDPEEFDLVWFGHTKGASKRRYDDYVLVRYQHHRRFWSRRAQIERFFADPTIGLFSHRYGPWDLTDLCRPSRGEAADVRALQRIYRAAYSPLGLIAWETVFVMRDGIVRRFCHEVGADFFRTDPSAWGADRWWFEGGFPSIASMQGYEPFIELDTDGAGSPRDDLVLFNDPRQTNRLAMEELQRWRADPLAFRPRGLPRG